MPHHTTTPTSSSSALRSRKVDFRKHFLVLSFLDAHDLDESSALNRCLPQVSTGVEKDEEEEHHLQAALVANHTHTQVVIPTPDASTLIPFTDYDSLYPPTFTTPKSLIRFSSVLEDFLGCPYNLDEQDLQFINTHDNLSHSSFELAIYALESAATALHSSSPAFIDCLPFLENIDPPLSHPILKSIYEYWKEKRQDSPSLIPKIKSDDMSSKPDSDPYVCFRRREIKPIRKTRRGDTQALEKLKRLRDDLLKAKMILDLVLEREATRKESLRLDHLIFEKRIFIRRLKRKLGINISESDADATPDRRKKSRKRTDLDDASESTKIRIPMQKLRDAANLVSDMDSRLFGDYLNTNNVSIEEKLRKMWQLDESTGQLDITDETYLGIGAEGNDFWKGFYFDDDQLLDTRRPLPPSLCRQSCLRRRIGRGGRIVFDRRIPRNSPSPYPPYPPRPFFSRHIDDSDIDEDLELEDDDRFLSYRAFSMPFKDDEYRLLTNKPSCLDHPHHISNSVSRFGLHHGESVQVIRAPPPSQLPQHVAPPAPASTSSNPPTHPSAPDNGAPASWSATTAPGTPSATTALTTPVKKRSGKASIAAQDQKQLPLQQPASTSMAQKKRATPDNITATASDPRSAALKSSVQQPSRQGGQQIPIQQQQQQQQGMISSPSFSSTTPTLSMAQQQSQIQATEPTTPMLANNLSIQSPVSSIPSSSHPLTAANVLTPSQIQQFNGHQLQLQQARAKQLRFQQQFQQSLAQQQPSIAQQMLMGAGQPTQQQQHTTADAQSASLASQLQVPSSAMSALMAAASTSSSTPGSQGGLTRQQLQQMYISQMQHQAHQTRLRFGLMGASTATTPMLGQPTPAQIQQHHAIMSGMSGAGSGGASQQPTGIIGYHQQHILAHKLKVAAAAAAAQSQASSSSGIPTTTTPLGFFAIPGGQDINGGSGDAVTALTNAVLFAGLDGTSSAVQTGNIVNGTSSGSNGGQDALDKV